jgi:acetyl-CoA carboxylase biotin carboxyl carrier protein
MREGDTGDTMDESAAEAAQHPTAEAADTAQHPAAAAISALADDLLPALAARLEATELGEIEVRTAGWRVRLRRSLEGAVRIESPSPGQTTAQVDAPATAPAAVPATAPAEGSPAAQVDVPAAHPDRPVQVALSPAVGFLVLGEGSGPGCRVKAGQLIGHVDCLGVLQEVLAPGDGVIARRLAEQGEAVEYGQPLFDIEAEPVPPSRGAVSATEGR